MTPATQPARSHGNRSVPLGIGQIAALLFTLAGVVLATRS
jgi:hypothetical protein